MPPQLHGCPEGNIRCNVKLEEVQTDHSLAWDPDVFLLDHVLAYEVSEQNRPI